MRESIGQRLDILTLSVLLTILPGFCFIVCNGCGLYIKIVHCYAITMEGKTAVVEKEDCTGCATCTDICPVVAVELRKGSRLQG